MQTIVQGTHPDSTLAGICILRDLCTLHYQLAQVEICNFCLLASLNWCSDTLNLILVSSYACVA